MYTTDSKAWFPLPELTARVNGRRPESTRVVETGLNLQTHQYAAHCLHVWLYSCEYMLNDTVLSSTVSLQIRFHVSTLSVN